MNSRSLLAPLFALFLPSIGSAQWTYLGNPDLFGSMAYMVVELEPGRYAVTLQEYGSISTLDRPQGRLVLIEENGSHAYAPLYTEPGWWLHGYGIFPDASRNKHHLWTIPRDTVTGEQLGILHVITDLDLQPTHTNLFDQIDSAHYIGWGVALTPNGDLVTASGFNTTGDLTLRDKLVVMRSSNNGELLGWATYQGSSFLVRDIMQEPEGLRVTLPASAGMGPEGYGKFLWFDNELDYINGIALPNANGNAFVSGQDTAFTVFASERCADGTYLVLCERVIGFLPWATNKRWPCLAKVSPEGDLLGLFYSPEPIPDAIPRAIHLGLARSADGHFVWGYERDDNEGEPSFIGIYKMDQDLNVLGEIHVDGTDENIHVWPNQLETTSDGGVLLAGWYYDLTTPAPARAWVSKLGGFTAVPQRPAPAWDVQVFPNPGEQIMVRINGPLMANGRMELLDARGRVVLQAPFIANLAAADARQLASGPYLYRIVDAAGTVVAAGQWVRQ